MMEAAITLPAGPTTGLFADVGGALFRRAARLLGDEAAAARVAEELFVRFVVHGNAQGMSARERWNWIYRVVTSPCLRQLSDDAIPGASAAAHGTQTGKALPAMGVLRRMDEATQSIVVLSVLDGLTPDEIAEVLGLPVERIRRRVAAKFAARGVADRPAARGSSGGGSDDPARQATHPSVLALDRDRELHVSHVSTCDRCRAVIVDGDRLTTRFAREIAPGAVIRVAAAVRVERARRPSGPRWRRVMWLGGGLAAVFGLALLVARPHTPDRVSVPYAGLKGASRAQAAGIQISVGRGAEVRPLDPTTAVGPGDRLYFRVRAERPRYLELRVHDSDGDKRLFPVGAGDAVLVRPGQAVGSEYLVGAPPPAVDSKGQSALAQKIWIVGLFCDHPFPLDRPPGPDVEEVPVRVDRQP